ncbi:hypothetical protein BGZ70_009814 [Mortierella alpina]|uniref:FAD-binding PCMH-type domain-containing protein n=1 Tax=Mortierella alpina TaxID=64518 RepID=A0A9P6J0H3_MORAP|nr:hypothetical protein BGZ70_009814 [Mortierella alpina]
MAISIRKGAQRLGLQTNTVRSDVSCSEADDSVLDLSIHTIYNDEPKNDTQLSASNVQPATPHTWVNWVGNQQSSPTAIFHPSTLGELQSIVFQARQAHKRIRCVASTFSMSSISKTNDYLVDTKFLSTIYRPTFDLEKTLWTVHVQSGVSIKALDDYLRKHDPPLAMASNILIESVLYGGIIATGAHGANINGRCLSDQLTEISIVDGAGTLQTFNAYKDAVEFSAACVNLGLLGIIYTLTLKVVPMANSRYHALDYKVPYHQLFDPLQKECGQRLKKLVQENASIQLLYFPFNNTGNCRCNDFVIIKTLNPTPELPTNHLRFPKLHHWMVNQELFHRIAKIVVVDLLPYWPSWSPLVTRMIYRYTPILNCVQEIPDAVHFMKNLERFPTWLVEFSMKCDEDHDYVNIIRAWDHVAQMVYETANEWHEYPLNVAMEARFNKASSCIMSPMYDEDPEALFFSIELVSGKNTQGFLEFSEMIAKIWMEQYGGL